MATRVSPIGSKTVDGVTPTILPASGILPRIKRVGRNNPQVQAVVHADDTVVEQLYKRLLADSGVPARVLSINGPTLKDAPTLFRQFLPKKQRTEIEQPSEITELALEVLRKQERHGGRTLVVVNEAHKIVHKGFGAISQLCDESDTRVVLFGNTTLYPQLKQLKGVKPAVMIVADDSGESAPAPAKEAAQAQVIDEDDFSITLQEALSTKPTAEPLEEPTQSRPIRQPALSLGLLAVGFALGWLAYDQFADGGDSSARPTSLSSQIDQRTETVPKESLISGPIERMAPPAIAPEVAQTAPPQQPPPAVDSAAPKPDPQPAVAPVATIPASSGQEEAVTGNAWLLAQGDDAYTLQLLAVTKESGLEWALAQYGQHPDVRWYEANTDDGSRRFVILLGTFDTYAEAGAAAESLPTQFPEQFANVQPWVRSFRILKPQATSN